MVSVILKYMKFSFLYKIDPRICILPQILKGFRWEKNWLEIDKRFPGLVAFQRFIFWEDLHKSSAERIIKFSR